MVDIIVIAVIGAMLLCAGIYIRRQKKRGAVCVGCPYAGQCSGCCGKNKE